MNLCLLFVFILLFSFSAWSQKDYLGMQIGKGCLDVQKSAVRNYSFLKVSNTDLVETGFSSYYVEILARDGK